MSGLSALGPGLVLLIAALLHFEKSMPNQLDHFFVLLSQLWFMVFVVVRAIHEARP